MLTVLSVAVAALLLAVEFFATWLVNRRARAFKQAAELRRLRGAPEKPDAPPSSSTGDDPPKRLAAGGATDAALDIPAALVGARWKEILERLAPALGTTPVALLRAALDAGLTGGRPITTEMLEMLDKQVKQARNKAPPGKRRLH
jgi:hypothetical protein